MCELQSTIEFSVELYKFYNVDLFQRGMYQVRCCLRVSSKLTVEVEVATPEVATGLGSAIVLGNYGACRPFQILYRNEEVSLKDVVLFRCHMLVDGYHLKETLEKAEFSLILELWFSDTSPASMVMVSSRTLQINLCPIDGLHYHLPVLFDYFHLSAISLTIHAALTALHQPSLKRGILKYMQSCAPKTSKSWSKTRSAQCSSLTDTVLPVTSRKIYNRINESPQIHLEAYNVLLEASNNLKSIIKEYRILLLQREEVIGENYESLIIKQNKYDFKKNSKKYVPIKQNSSLAELCADNIKLWNYFLLNFSCKTAIQQKLSKKHHSMRVRRFSELFFLVYNPRRTAFGCYETNYQKYLLIAEIARRSKYMQLLPPLPVHCAVLDGDNITMPVIFEDQYQDFTEPLLRNSHHMSLSSSPLITKPEIPFRKTNVPEENSCSCGIGNILDMRKNSEKSLVNPDFNAFMDQIHSSMPTRHSKSLDQLQMCQKNNLHYSQSNIRSQNVYSVYDNDGRMGFRKKESKLKNVVSEHNIRNHRKILENEIEAPSKILNCTGKGMGNCSSANVRKSSHSQNVSNLAESSMEIYQNGTLVKKPKQFDRKIPNGTQKYKKLVKSFSHTSTESTQNLFRSNSMQLFSPRKKIVNDVNKFNSLVTKRHQNQKSNVETTKRHIVEYVAPSNNQNTVIEQKNQRVKTKYKSKSQIRNRNFHISSTSSSTESLSICKKVTGLHIEASNNTGGIRRVKSSSQLDEDKIPLILSRSESLPNIIPKIEDRLIYSNVKYFSSCSTSSNSEQSGWITSRSSSSSAEMNPLTTTVINNLETLQRKLQNLSTDHKIKEKISDRNVYHKRKKKRTAAIDFTNGHKKNYRKLNLEIPSFKGCDLNETNICDDVALPPPKQFRDLDSPSSSVTNGTNEEETNGIDNILYHVIDVQTNIDIKPSQFSFKGATETEEIHFYKGSNIEMHKAFIKSKTEFKRQLSFPGILYSDLNLFASTVPYFHVSDEFRIFSPEGMHLIVCVHGLDGNSADLRLVKTYLELGLPGAYLDFLMSERNQGDTFSDFETMTDRLVSEILHYLDTSSIRPTRVSFVGHSLGNIIIRSALTRPQMKFLLPRLHTFLSLSGPHLGTLYNSSGLVNMGMWFMQKWKKSGSLLQLCLKDANDSRQSFLYRLSQRSTIHHFKNILLCGSGQDRYVPLHSARIELCKEAIKDNSEQGAIFREMVHNIMSPIISKKEVKLLRYDIHHALPNTANTLIGRAAHIAVLDSELFIEKFMAVVGIKYFR